MDRMVKRRQRRVGGCESLMAEECGLLNLMNSSNSSQQPYSAIALQQRLAGIVNEDHDNERLRTVSERK